MSNDLTISLGVELNESDLSSIQGKIDALTGKKSKIKLDIDTKDTSAAMDKVISNFEKRGAKLKLDIDAASLSKLERFDIFRDSNNQTYKTVARINNELGKTTTLTKQIGKDGKTTLSKQISTNYKEIQKAADTNSKYLSDQFIKIADLQSKAFNQNNPLTGNFKETADEAINYWKSKIDEAKTYTGKLTQEQQNTIKEAEAYAKRVVLEQQKSQFRGDKLAAKDVSQKVSTADFGLDIQIEELKQAGQYSDEAQQKIQNLKQSLSEVKDQKGFDEWSQQLQKFNQELELTGERAKTALKAENFDIDTKVLSNRFDNIKKKYEEIISANPSKINQGIEEQFAKIQEAINNVNPQNISTVRKEIQLLNTQVNGLQPQSLSQILSENFGGIGQYLSRFASTTFLITKGIQVAKSMINEVTGIDSSLMELQKVTSLSGQSLDDFTDKAYKAGEGLGRTGKDVIDAVTTFSRAGYDLDQSTELAKSALVMSNVGVDIPNMESAASDMISIMKAYQIEAEDSMSVIDKLYNVANKEPLDFGNITDMLVTAGGTLSQTNTTLEETMGLLTGGFATLRDNSVANG